MARYHCDTPAAAHRPGVQNDPKAIDPQYGKAPVVPKAFDLKELLDAVEDIVDLQRR
jgi:hypothetical protein